MVNCTLFRGGLVHLCNDFRALGLFRAVDVIFVGFEEGPTFNKSPKSELIKRETTFARVHKFVSLVLDC